MKKQQDGFTVIEIIFTACILIFASILFFVQKNNVEVIARDDSRKTAINAMYYSLEKVFYVQNGYYPQTISSDNLTSMDPELFTDPNGIALGESGSNYTYEPKNCVNEQCKSYTLKADLENEDDYSKNSDH